MVQAGKGSSVTASEAESVPQEVWVGINLDGDCVTVALSNGESRNLPIDEIITVCEHAGWDAESDPILPDPVLAFGFLLPDRYALTAETTDGLPSLIDALNVRWQATLPRYPGFWLGADSMRGMDSRVLWPKDWLGLDVFDWVEDRASRSGMGLLGRLRRFFNGRQVGVVTPQIQALMSRAAQVWSDGEPAQRVFDKIPSPTAQCEGGLGDVIAVERPRRLGFERLADVLWVSLPSFAALVYLLGLDSLRTIALFVGVPTLLMLWLVTHPRMILYRRGARLLDILGRETLVLYSQIARCRVSKDELVIETTSGDRLSIPKKLAAPSLLKRHLEEYSDQPITIDAGV